VRIRAATKDDLAVLETLWRAFESEYPEPPYVDLDIQAELHEVAEIVDNEVALVAERDGGDVVGFVLARRRGSRLGVLTDIYVVPAARRGGVARQLVAGVVERLRDLGLDTVRLDVLTGNTTARTVYAHWGFREEELTLVASLDQLAQRVAATADVTSRGAVFVQSDDVAAVDRAVHAFAPRIGSHESDVAEPANGWTTVRDSVASRDPAALRRLGKELSDRLGAVVVLLGIEADAVVRLIAFERGSVMDEYLSVPEFHGPLPPGDVVALAANPTVLARLTGGESAAIRAATPTATSPTELPDVGELVAGVASALGLPPFEL
jgi:ribosomal protein S18 acetylase RimI-like enzyme